MFNFDSNFNKYLPDFLVKPVEKKEDKPTAHTTSRVQPVSDNSSAKFEETAQSMLKSVLLHEVEKVPYVSAATLQERLQPGDIFLSYYPSSAEVKDFALRAGQKITQLLKDSAFTEESHNIVHAALYVGNGRISEAVANGVVINQLESQRFKIEPGKDHGFLVVRPSRACERGRAHCRRSGNGRGSSAI
jgi:hypothetical protein